MNRKPILSVRHWLSPAPVIATFAAVFGLGIAQQAQAQTPVLSIDTPSRVFEGNGAGRNPVNPAVTTPVDLTIRANPAPTTDLTVNVVTSDGTAKAGSDYNAVNTTVVIPAGQTQVQTTVQVIADDLYEGTDENFFVTVSAAGASSPSPGNRATITIGDDDNPPILNVADATVTEGNSGQTTVANFVVSLTDDQGNPYVTAVPVTFTYTTQDIDSVNATAGTDYAAKSGTGTIAAGQSQVSIPVNVIGDNVDEADESFYFIIDPNSVTNASAANTQATGTILDNDNPTATISDSTAVESDGSISFTVTLSGTGSPQQIVLGYTTAQSSAKPGSDYGTQGNTAEVSGTITFAPFQTVQEVTIPLIDDNIFENTEIFLVNLRAVSGGITLTGTGADAQAVGTINDDDSVPTIIVPSTFKDTEGSTGGTKNFVIPVTLSNPTNRAVTFRYQTKQNASTTNQAVEGTSASTAGADYVRTSGTVTIPAGQIFATTDISIPVISDTIDENDESFQVLITNISPVGVVSNGGDKTINVTIQDDDQPQVGFTDDDINVEVDEGNQVGTKRQVTNLTFLVQLSAVSTKTVSVQYRTVDGTAKNRQDYMAKSGTLRFPAGSTTPQAITIPILGDNVNEPDETFTVQLSSPGNAVLASGHNISTVTITNDDALPTVSISTPSSQSAGVKEGRTAPNRIFFTVSLSAASSQTVTVDYATVDGSAVSSGANPDYVSASGTITFNPGETTKVISVLVRDDNLHENDENFSVNLTNIVNAQLGTTTAIATIIDDDAVPAINISSNSVDEGLAVTPQGGTQGPLVDLPFVATLTRPTEVDVDFTVETFDGAQAGRTAATAGTDYFGTTQRLRIPAGQTTAQFVVTVRGDNLYEDDEQFGVRVVPGSVNNAIIGSSGIGTIVDDEAPVNASIDAPDDDNSAIEPYYITTGNNRATVGGRNAIFPVTLSGPVGKDVVVRYSVLPGANPGTTNADFQGVTGTITFPANAGGATPTQNIVVRPAADNIDEDTENYIVLISSADAGVPAAGQQAASTVEDRTPAFDSFDPNQGNEGVTTIVTPTLVTFTGNQFRTDNIGRVDSVLFNGKTPATDIRYIDDDSFTVTVPDNAFSGPLTIVLNNGVTLNPRAANFTNRFYVQPVIDSFGQLVLDRSGKSSAGPARGVIGATQVVVYGHHFLDPNNRVTGVQFGTGGGTAGAQVISDTEIRTTVPGGAVTGPLFIVTQNGGVGPQSPGTFIIDTFTVGDLAFDIGNDSTVIYENATGTTSLPVATYNLFVTPALESDNTILAPRGSIRVQVSFTSPVGQSPTIELLAGQGGRITGSQIGSTAYIDLPAGYDVTYPIQVVVLSAGDDSQPPTAATQGVPNSSHVSLPVADAGVALSLSASITRSNDTTFYPVGATPDPNPITVRRLDFRGIEADTTTVLRTSEDPASPDNKTSFPLNLANLDFPNPSPFIRGGGINTDARPKADVFLPLRSTDTTEGLITYYVIQNGKKIYPDGGIPSATTTVIYAVDPTRPEYYRNLHYIEVTGVDDNIADTAQTYQVILDTAANNPNNNSSDPEYKFNITAPFVLVNTDNEQSGNGQDKGYTFSKTNLTTSELGTTDFFTVKLRQPPSSGKVTVDFTTTNPSEVQFVDPANPNGSPKEKLRITFYASQAGDGKTSTRWDTPLTIRVIGIDDDIVDGNTTTTLTTTIVPSLTDDTTYKTIDPTDLTVTNQDDEGQKSIITSKSSLLTDESGKQDNFTLRLSAKPMSGNVTLDLTTTNPSEFLLVDPLNPDGPALQTLRVAFNATQTGNGKSTSRWDIPLNIKVVGVDDDIQDGTVQQFLNITVNTALTDDATYKTLPPLQLLESNADNESASAITVSPTTLLLDEGTTNTFRVRLNQKPTDNVVIAFQSSNTSVATVSPNRITFTPANYSTAQSVTVRGILDGSSVDSRQATIITSNASSGDPNFDGLDVPDVVVTVQNTESAFVISQGNNPLQTSEGGLTDTFTVALSSAPTSNVTINLRTAPSTEARLKVTGTATPATSVALTFTPANYATAQTVTVVGVDDSTVDGDQVFSVIGTLVTSDANYSQQSFPPLNGVNADNDSTTGGNSGGTTFAANTTSGFSLPYAASTTANANISPDQIFSLPMFNSNGTRNYTIYKFNAAGQKNNRVAGGDFVEIARTEKLVRGVGYRIVTGNSAVTMKSPADSTAIKVFNGTSYTFNLTRNANFVSQTGLPQSVNGYNYIGFPFNPSLYSRVALETAQITAGGNTYDSLSAAAAAGVISNKLYTVDSNGVLTQLSSNNVYLRPYQAYFVQVFRDNVTLTLRQPS